MRRLSVFLLLVEALLAGCAGSPAKPETGARTPSIEPPPPASKALTLAPSGRPAERYGVRPPPQLDAFQAAVVAGVQRVAASAGQRPPPQSDGAVNAVALDVCRGLPGAGPPPAQLVEFAMRVHGLVDPPPHIVVADISTTLAPEMAEQVVRRLEEVVRAGHYDRVGVGVCRPSATPGLQRTVFALVDTRVRLIPIARRAPLGQRSRLDFTVHEGYENVRLVVASPDTRVQSVALRKRADGRFTAGLLCEQTGVYRIELTGEGEFGDEVLANFPIHCGQAPPVIVRYGVARPLPATAEQAEGQLFTMTNEYRKKAGRRPLRHSEALDHVARAHGLDMMNNGFLGHLSPRTGSPAERLRRAGVRYLVVRENIAQAYSVEEALQELINSPAHRANLLGDDVTHLGVGVVIDRSEAVPVLLVTQNFTRTGEPFSAQTAPDVLLVQINRERDRAGLTAVSRTRALDQLAHAYLEDVLSRSEAAAGTRLSRALQQRAEYVRVQGLFVKASALEAFEGQKQVVDPALTHVGLAVRRSGDEILIVALLAEAEL